MAQPTEHQKGITMLRLTLSTLTSAALTSAALAGLFLSSGFSLDATPALPGSTQPLAVVMPQNQLSTFLKRFDSAYQTKDEKGMLRAITKYPNETINHFEILANQYNMNGDSRLAPRMDKYKELFQKAHLSTILEKIEDYTAEWGDEERKIRLACERKYRQYYGALKAYQAGKQEEDKNNAYSMLEEALEGYKDLGDMWQYSLALLAKFGLSRDLEKESIERMETQIEIITEFLKVRKEDLDYTRDKDYAAWSNWLKGFKMSLETAKKGGGLPGDVKKKADIAKAKPKQAELTKYLPGSKWTRVEMQISMLKEPVDSICAYGSSNPMDWAVLGVEGTKPAEMKSFEDGKIFVKREGANKYMALVDAVGKKNKPKRLPVGNKPKGVWLPYFKQGEEDEPYDYAFFFWTGSSQQGLFSVAINLAPEWGQRKYALLFYRSAAVLHATIEGTKIKLYDDNFNGVVGEDPAKIIRGDRLFGSGIEAKTGTGHPAFDSMMVGKSKHLQPFSRYIHIDDYWYKLNVLGNNENLNYRPMDPANIPTGRVKMQFKGPGKAKPDYLIIQGQGFLKGAYFDIANVGSKGIEVPAGQYVIYYGRVINGEGNRAMNATMLTGESKPFNVVSGEMTKVKVGAPYTIQFEVEQDGNEVIVDASKFWVKGVGGELYGRIGAEILEPDLVWSKKNTGKSGKVLGSWRRMKGADDLRAIREKYNAFVLDAPYFPVTDREDKTVDVKLSVKKPVKSGAFFVGVRQKGHKLFKNLLPVWK